MNAIARSSETWSTNFFVVDGLLEARTHAERASILLRLSDAVIAAKVEHLQDACRETGFQAGVDFLSLRLAQHCATRTETGEMPKAIVEQLEYWRNGMVAIAGAWP